MLYILGRFIFFVLSKIFLSYNAFGRDNLPKKGAFIVASNHASYFDPIFIGIGMHQPLNFMARETLFKNPIFGAIIRSTHAFPVKRNFQDVGAMREAISRLKRGKPLLVFPEATRTLDGNLQFERVKGGISFLASEGGVSVIPAYIKGSYSVLPKGAKSIKVTPISVYFGKPLDFNEFVKSKAYQKQADAYKPFADFIMQEIAKLKENCNEN